MECDVITVSQNIIRRKCLVSSATHNAYAKFAEHESGWLLNAHVALPRPAVLPHSSAFTALCAHSTSRSSSSSSSNWVKFLPNPYGRTRPWGLLSLLTEMSTRNIKIIMFLGSKVRGGGVRRAYNLTTIWVDCLVNVGSLTSHNPIGLHGLLRG
jgi:hypothetical protein